MVTVIACVFPLLVVAIVLIAVAPRVPELPPRSGEEAEEPSPFPLPPRQNRVYVLGYLVTVALVAASFWVVQARLFAAVAADPSVLFSHRLSDLPIFAVIPALMVGFMAAPSILDRVVREHLHWPAIAWMARPIRIETRGLRPMAWIWAIMATLANVAALDTFLVIGPTEFKYSHFSSLTTDRHATADVAELRVWSQRQALIGGKVGEGRNLEIRLKSGAFIDTNFLIERPDLPQVLAAFERTTGFQGRITYVDGHR